MAKRKTKTRTVFRKAKSKRRSSSGGGVSPMKVAVTAGAYGAMRDKIQGYIPDTGIPYSDSVVLGVAGYWLAKKKGWLKNLGISMLAVEAAAIGNTMVNTGSVNNNGAMQY